MMAPERWGARRADLLEGALAACQRRVLCAEMLNNTLELLRSPIPVKRCAVRATLCLSAALAKEARPPAGATGREGVQPRRLGHPSTLALASAIGMPLWPCWTNARGHG